MFKDKPWNILLILALLLVPFYIIEMKKSEQPAQGAEVIKSADQAIHIQKSPTIKNTSDASVPDFSSITDVKEKKKVFFDYFYQLVLIENKKLLQERQTLLSAKASKAQLQRLCEKYAKDCDVIDAEKVLQLQKRIDVIPPALVLAQAAKESGWGGSRFAKDANNYFGQWCFTKGCGLVPANRIEGANHEVRKFASVQDSVRAYLFNLNTSNAYQELREMRHEQRGKHGQFYGLDLAASLLYYSERREAYVEELQSFIRFNQLKKYDETFWMLFNES